MFPHVKKIFVLFIRRLLRNVQFHSTLYWAKTDIASLYRIY